LENFSTKKKSPKTSSLKSSTVNTLLNVSIFVLSVLIVYMSYSVYIKLSHKPTENVEQSNNKAASDLIQVEVLNGCGIGGVADKFTEYLRNRNIDIVRLGNYISNDVSETMVIEHLGNMENAYKIAHSLGIKDENVIQQLNKDYFLDATIVIGRDYFNLTPYK
jgi:hypothetical protein